MSEVCKMERCPAFPWPKDSLNERSFGRIVRLKSRKRRKIGNKRVESLTYGIRKMKEGPGSRQIEESR
jgi:hypothetical protein